MWAPCDGCAPTTVLYLTLNPITAMVLRDCAFGGLTPELVAGMVLVLVGIVIGSGV
jgi:hypothetical protein